MLGGEGEGGEEGERALSRVVVVERGWDRLFDTRVFIQT